MGELAEADRGGVAVARDAQIDQVAVGEIGAGQHRRHAAVDAVEAVALAEEIGRRLRRAADPRQLGDAVRREVELEAGLDDRRGDRVVAAAGAERRDRALVVAVGEAELVLRQRRDGGIGFGDIGHSAASSVGVTPTARASCSAIALRDEARGDRRAVVVQDGMSRAGSSGALVDQQRAQLGVAVLLDHEDLVVRER